MRTHLNKRQKNDVLSRFTAKALITTILGGAAITALAKAWPYGSIAAGLIVAAYAAHSSWIYIRIEKYCAPSSQKEAIVMKYRHFKVPERIAKQVDSWSREVVSEEQAVKRARRGRPKKGEIPETVTRWRVQATLELRAERYAEAQRTAGTFVLLSDDTRRSATELLQAYKSQQNAVAKAKTGRSAIPLGRGRRPALFVKITALIYGRIGAGVDAHGEVPPDPRKRRTERVCGSGRGGASQMGERAHGDYRRSYVRTPTRRGSDQDDVTGTGGAVYQEL